MYNKSRTSYMVRTFVAACFYYSGLVPLLRLWVRRSGHRLIIICLHQASGGNLRNQLLYLRRHYRLLSFEAALDELYSPETNEISHSANSHTSLVVTFDDGYRDNYTHAFALARDLHVPLTIFLIPGYITSGSRYWWLESDYLVRRTVMREVSIDGRLFRLNDEKQRKELAGVIDAHLRYASSVAEREAFLRSVREALAVPSSMSHCDGASMPLTWPEVRDMDASGWITFGAHTMHHPVMACLEDPAEVDREAKECRISLERQLGHEVRTFAYPIGRLEHIGDYGLRAVREARYDAAVTTISGVNTPRTNPYLLRRMSASTSDHWLVLAAQAVGIWSFFFRPKGKTQLHAVSQLRPLSLARREAAGATQQVTEEMKLVE